MSFFLLEQEATMMGSSEDIAPTGVMGAGGRTLAEGQVVVERGFPA
jgi:hypothetical protein